MKAARSIFEKSSTSFESESSASLELRIVVIWSRCGSESGESSSTLGIPITAYPHLAPFRIVGVPDG